MESAVAAAASRRQSSQSLSAGISSNAQFLQYLHNGMIASGAAANSMSPNGFEIATVISSKQKQLNSRKRQQQHNYNKKRSLVQTNSHLQPGEHCTCCKYYKPDKMKDWQKQISSAIVFMEDDFDTYLQLQEKHEQEQEEHRGGGEDDLNSSLEANELTVRRVGAGGDGGGNNGHDPQTAPFHLSDDNDKNNANEDNECCYYSLNKSCESFHPHDLDKHELEQISEEREEQESQLLLMNKFIESSQHLRSDILESRRMSQVNDNGKISLGNSVVKLGSIMTVTSLGEPSQQRQYLGEDDFSPIEMHLLQSQQQSPSVQQQSQQKQQSKQQLMQNQQLQNQQQQQQQLQQSPLLENQIMTGKRKNSHVRSQSCPFSTPYFKSNMNGMNAHTEDYGQSIRVMTIHEEEPYQNYVNIKTNTSNSNSTSNNNNNNNNGNNNYLCSSNSSSRNKYRQKQKFQGNAHAKSPKKLKHSNNNNNQQERYIHEFEPIAPPQPTNFYRRGELDEDSHYLQSSFHSEVYDGQQKTYEGDEEQQEATAVAVEDEEKVKRQKPEEFQDSFTKHLQQQQSSSLQIQQSQFLSFSGCSSGKACGSLPSSSKNFPVVGGSISGSLGNPTNTNLLTQRTERRRRMYFRSSENNEFKKNSKPLTSGLLFLRGAGTSSPKMSSMLAIQSNNLDYSAEKGSLYSVKSFPTRTKSYSMSGQKPQNSNNSTIINPAAAAEQITQSNGLVFFGQQSQSQPQEVGMINLTHAAAAAAATASINPNRIFSLEMIGSNQNSPCNSQQYSSVSHRLRKTSGANNDLMGICSSNNNNYYYNDTTDQGFISFRNENSLNTSKQEEGLEDNWNNTRNNSSSQLSFENDFRSQITENIAYIKQMQVIKKSQRILSSKQYFLNKFAQTLKESMKQQSQLQQFSPLQAPQLPLQTNSPLYAAEPAVQPSQQIEQQIVTPHYPPLKSAYKSATNNSNYNIKLLNRISEECESPANTTTFKQSRNNNEVLRSALMRKSGFFTSSSTDQQQPQQSQQHQQSQLDCFDKISEMLSSSQQQQQQQQPQQQPSSAQDQLSKQRASQQKSRQAQLQQNNNTVTQNGYIDSIPYQQVSENSSWLESSRSHLNNHTHNLINNNSSNHYAFNEKENIYTNDGGSQPSSLQQSVDNQPRTPVSSSASSRKTGIDIKQPIEQYGISQLVKNLSYCIDEGSMIRDLLALRGGGSSSGGNSNSNKNSSNSYSKRPLVQSAPFAFAESSQIQSNRSRNHSILLAALRKQLSSSKPKVLLEIEAHIESKPENVFILVLQYNEFQQIVLKGIYTVVDEMGSTAIASYCIEDIAETIHIDDVEVYLSIDPVEFSFHVVEQAVAAAAAAISLHEVHGVIIRSNLSG